jgi:hypothetical protein
MTRIAHMREADARVAGGSLDHGAAGLEDPAPLGVQHDPLGGAILHRAAGIHEFRFAENFAAGLFAHAAQPNQGSIADNIRKSVTDTHQ